MTCPTQSELTDCLLGKLPEIRTQAVLEHSAQCESCQRVMDQIDDTSDGLIASLRFGDPGWEATAPCERMIQRAENLVPANPVAPVPVEPKTHLLEGRRVRDYEIVKPIGEGGMGAVFLAKHVRLKRNVAVKVLSLGRQRDAEAQKRFEQEMQIVGQLQHRGIVQALDAGEDQGIQYLVMEVIDGADLRRIVRLLGPLSLADACELTAQAAVALQYAHSQKLIHRDVKPSNIMLARDGTAKVMDLGIARFADQTHALTSTQQALGSLDFMAPEQLQSHATDARADVYALGCTLHFLLTGEPPERRRTASLLVSKAPKLDGLRHVLPPPLTHLMQQMLLPNPAERCENMGEVVERLQPFCSGANLIQLAAKAAKLVSQEELGESASPTSAVPQPKRLRNRNRNLKTAAAIITCSLLSVLLTVFALRWLKQQPEQPIASLPSVSSNIEPVGEIPLFQIHQAAINSAAYCTTTAQLIIGSQDQTISIRDLPNQEQIYQIRASDVAVKQVEVLNQPQRLFALDAKGILSSFQLPNVQLMWTKDLRKFGTPERLIAENGQVFVILQDTSQLSIELLHGKVIERVENQDFDEVTSWSAAFEKHYVSIDSSMLFRPYLDSDMQFIVADDHLARLIDLDSASEPHFVYAEHEASITTILTFVDEPLVLTADEMGVVRLWQAPKTRYSNLWLSCKARLDSMEMTFALGRDRWSKSAFAPLPQKGNLNDQSGTMQLRTEIERDQQTHTLQYRQLTP